MDHDDRLIQTLTKQIKRVNFERLISSHSQFLLDILLKDDVFMQPNTEHVTETPFASFEQTYPTLENKQAHCYEYLYRFKRILWGHYSEQLVCDLLSVLFPTFKQDFVVGKRLYLYGSMNERLYPKVTFKTTSKAVLRLTQRWETERSCEMDFMYKKEWVVELKCPYMKRVNYMTPKAEYIAQLVRYCLYSHQKTGLLLYYYVDSMVIVLVEIPSSAILSANGYTIDLAKVTSTILHPTTFKTKALDRSLMEFCTTIYTYFGQL